MSICIYFSPVFLKSQLYIMCIIFYSIDQAKQVLSREKPVPHSDKDVWPSIVNNDATIFGTKLENMNWKIA